MASTVRVDASPLQGHAWRETSRGRNFVRALTRNRGALVGLIVLLLLILMAIFAPAITNYNPTKINPPRQLQPPSRAHWLGTDGFGRDQYTRIVYGARISLPVGLIAVAISSVAGVVLGLMAGYYGKWIDSLIMRLMDILLAFPGILLAIMVVAILGTNLQNVMIAVGVANVPRFTRLVRGSVLTAREHLYVDAARAAGATNNSILFRHILPNIVGPTVVFATLSVGTAILSAAGLSFLGLGAQPPTPEWGTMLSDARQFLQSDPWVASVPGIAILITVLAVNMFGDGLRDILDPRMRA